MSNSIRTSLIALIAGINEVNAQMTALAEKRGGTYTGMVALGIAAKTESVFETEVEAVFNDIRNNVEGLGTKTGCSLGKADKDGNAKYTIPSGIMSAKSVVKSALAYELDLENEEGEPVAFSQLRKSVAAARDEQARAALSEDDLAVLDAFDRIRSKLDGIVAVAAGLETLTSVEALEADVEKLLTVANELVKAEVAVTEAEAEAAQAEDEADAVAALLADEVEADLASVLADEPEVEADEEVRGSTYTAAALALVESEAIAESELIALIGYKDRYGVADIRAAVSALYAEAS